MIEIIEVDKKDPKKVKVVGKTQFLLRDALKNEDEKGRKMTLFILDEKNRYKGKFEVGNCSARRYYTFFDLVFRNQLNIVPIIGVDFSMANLTFNDQQFCIHTLKPGAPNDYVEALKGVNQAFSPFSNFNLAYGIGARTHIRGEGQDACDLFSMSGDFQDPFTSSEEELLSCY